jgi:hypothetical protein
MSSREQVVEYPYTYKDLSAFIDDLPSLFISGPVDVLPADCIVVHEDINQNQNFPAGTQHLCIKRVGLPAFRIFDVNGDLDRIRRFILRPILPIVGTLVRYHAESQVLKNLGELPQQIAARKPWENIVEQSIAWQSHHDCLDLDIYRALCGEREQAEATQTDGNWIEDSTWKLMFQGDQYDLTHRQYQIIKILKYQPDSMNGVTREQLLILFNDSYPQPNLTDHFRINHTFKNRNSSLLGSLINIVGPKPFKYSLSVALAIEE